MIYSHVIAYEIAPALRDALIRSPNFQDLALRTEHLRKTELRVLVLPENFATTPRSRSS